MINKYIIRYNYYQYNSGLSDNGYYNKELSFDSYDKAFETYQKMKSFIKNELSDYEKEQLVDDYLPYSGYFTDVKIFKVLIEEIIL